MVNLLKTAVSRAVYSVMFRMSVREVSHEIKIYAIAVKPEDAASGVAKVVEALEILEKHDPKRINTLQRCLWGVFVMKLASIGQYSERSGLCLLSLDFVLAPTTTPAGVATILVHEATHARLDARGITERTTSRERIEFACIKAERALVRRLPGGEELLPQINERAEWIEQGGYSNEFIIESKRRTFAEFGFPNFLAKPMLWMARRRLK